MTFIRKFTEKDVPFVAALYQKANLASDPGQPKPSLQNICEGFNEVFLRNPRRDENLSSLVCEDGSGAVVGFLGISPRRMAIKGRPILAAVSAHLMLEPGRKLGLAGVRLLQQFLSGPQQLSIADQSTELGRKIWDGIGGQTSYIHSLEWVKVLRPSAHALSVAAGKFHLPIWLSKMTRPLVRFPDLALARLSPYRYRFTPSDLIAKDLDNDILLSCIKKFSLSRSLYPEYDEITLPWVIRRAESMKRLGDLRKIVLHDDSGGIAGWYLYYHKPMGGCEVLQLFARKGFTGAVLDHLFYHAWSDGSELIIGRLEPQLLPALSSRACHMKCGPPWFMVHSRDPEILQAIESGDIFFSHLEGEWCAGYRL